MAWRLLSLVLAGAGALAPARVPLRPTAARFEVAVVAAPTANLLFTIDMLAGPPDVPVAVVDAFRRTWFAEAGRRPGDDDMLARWRSVRMAAVAAAATSRVEPSIHHPLGDSLVPPGRERRTLFLAACLAAPTVDEAAELVEAVGGTADDGSVVRQVAGHFDRRFQTVWARRCPRLVELASELDGLARRAELGPFLDQVAGFYRADEAERRFVVHVLWAPPGGAQTAAVGNHLPLPVPDDATWNEALLIRQLGVIAHEASHYLLSALDGELKSRVTTEFAEACGLVRTRHANLLDEALQTALGNALFLQRRFPEQFDSHDVWYAFEPELEVPYAVDEYAKALLPSLVEALDETHEPFYPTFLRRAIAVYRSTFTVRPRDLARVAFVVGHRSAIALLDGIVPGRARWGYPLDQWDVAGKDLMECPGRTTLFLLRSADVAALDEGRLVGGLGRDRLQTLLSAHPWVLLTVPRDERGYVFVVLARDDWQLRRALIRFHSLLDVPTEPLFGS